jgi:Transglutaminase-like superfamily
MKKLIFVLTIIFVFNGILNAQQRKNKLNFDNIIINIPDSLTSSSQDIANFIDSEYTTQDSKIQALYIWITKNIDYNIESMYSFNNDTIGIISKTLKTRKGICYNYASLFSDISNRLGIKSIVITGYTKIGKRISYNPHSWCATMIDSSWFIFDPTWGSGRILHTHYIKQIDEYYYKMLPNIAIQTHMPFDPLFQFLNYTISNNDFCGIGRKDKYDKVFFNFNDSLKVFENLPNNEQLIYSKRRMENNGVNSYLIFTIINQIRQEIENMEYNRMIDEYHMALNSYKLGIYQFNRFIDSRNNHFSKFENDSILSQTLDSVKISFNLSIDYLKCIDNPNQDIQKLMDNIYKSIESNMLSFKVQRLFLDLYLKTPKNYRKSLFYDKM